jgi:hypothetical protein
VGRIVSQWNADRLAAEASAAAARAARPHRVSKWAYPAAAIAACALISWGIWWASNSGVNGVLRPVVATTTVPGGGDEAIVQVAVADEDPVEDPGDDPTAVGGSGRGAAWRDRLDALEADVFALSGSSEGSFDGVETR